MRKIMFSAVALVALAEGDDVCPSGQTNVNAAGSPVKCETDVTATTPAPDIVEDAADVAKDAGEAVKDAGEAVADTVSDAVKDIAD
mgnify:CR=1 FL=1